MNFQYGQGIVNAPIVNGSVSFLKMNLTRNNDVAAVDIYVEQAPVRAVITSGENHYIVEEKSSIVEAWTIADLTKDQWLFWDIDRETGQLSRGITYIKPSVGSVEPTLPVGGLWYDTSAKQMKIRTSTGWDKVLRVFAGYISGSHLQHYQLESQANISGPIEAGYVLSDSDDHALLDESQNVVSSTEVVADHQRLNLDVDVLNKIAKEPLPRFSVITVKPDGVHLWQPGDVPSGMVEADTPAGEVASIIVSAVVNNKTWNFKTSEISQPIFASSNGQLSTDGDKKAFVGMIVGRNEIVFDPKLSHVNHTAMPSIGSRITWVNRANRT
jgi:hypothetical protein